jgi:hypothetical protein
MAHRWRKERYLRLTRPPLAPSSITYSRRQIGCPFCVFMSTGGGPVGRLDLFGPPQLLQEVRERVQAPVRPEIVHRHLGPDGRQAHPPGQRKSIRQGHLGGDFGTHHGQRVDSGRPRDVEGPAKGHRPRLSQGKIAALLVSLVLSHLARRFLNALVFTYSTTRRGTTPWSKSSRTATCRSSTS